ncbi:MAG: N-acetylmuramoyl-L-alanine amidase [Rhodospirillales bacterium]|nr:N-acetylmuramoyl-L-alanine amidase [Rhodospirillales bacterium]
MSALVVKAAIAKAAARARSFAAGAIATFASICFAAFATVAVPVVHAAAALAAPTAAVTGAVVDRDSALTRIALDLSDQVAFNVFTLADPHRVVIDLAGVSWRAGAADGGAGGPCAALRHGEVRPGTWRIVLECRAGTAIRKALLQKPGNNSGYRLLVELAPGPQKGVLGYMSTEVRSPEPPVRLQERPRLAPPAEPGAPRSLVGETRMAALSPSLSPSVLAAVQAFAEEPVAPPAASPGPAAAMAAPPPAKTAMAAPQPARKTSPVAPPAMTPKAAEVGATSVSMPLPARRPSSPRAPRVVVLDPGHGGADPGAIGVSGVYEKDITLAAAREIKRALEQAGGYKVLLTRNDDRFIRLRDRVEFARRAGAELFVSVHADSVSSREVRGASVYTLSTTASDSEAAALAEKENKADLIAGLDLSGESSEVTNILIDLAQRETMNQSAAFAGHVVEQLADATGLLPNPHRFAGFAVLKAPDIPSVLIELGFLSNRNDERALLKSDSRTRVAAAMAKAIDGYLDETMSASAW